ncbi:uncharacterized protein LOC106804503 [Setaria italica]|uniref:uncharacterized protein LOC106804503 n=1 Tax=Setaria italica TaxID=4555 RepID=UPI0007199E5E|nr:uncharacterized protein LOC106804503 [Setaria italica]
MVGPFKITPGSYTHIFVVVDKFTKWIEVKAITNIESAKAAQFINEIAHRFGVPNRIITDLGKQFTGFEFWDFCQDNLINSLWGLQTLKSWAAGYTPFFMVYSSKAILPSDVAFGAPCIQYYEEGKAETSRWVDIDNLKEHRVAALIQHACHEQ